MTDDYLHKLEEVNRYQDFIVDQLRKQTPAFIIQQYNSKKYQFDTGESSSGFEIKYNSKMRETGRIYIETAEKSYDHNGPYIPSGIMRNDNTIFFLFGDYSQALLIAKKTLIWAFTCDWLQRELCIKMVQTKTSQGFLIPISKLISSPFLIAHFHFS